jgi:hypothetical protein
MRDVIENLATFLGVRMSTDGIGEMSLKQQAVVLINQILEPWLHRLTMREIGEITFAAGHGFGESNRGLRTNIHCRRKYSFPKGVNFKTRVFTGPDLRSYTESRYDTSESITVYRELYWALTRTKRWLRIAIYYEIGRVPKGGKIKNISLVVKEVFLGQLVGDNWSHSILVGLFKEIERAINQKVEDMQELVKLQTCLEIIDRLIRHEAVVKRDGLVSDDY